MKTRTRTTLDSLVLSVCVLLACAANIHATDGTWNNAGGNWSSSANWNGGIIADGAGDKVFFNALDIITNLTILNPITVNIDDVARTNSNLIRRCGG